MERLYVKPKLWFETEIDKHIYKCKIKRHGLTYATIHIKEIVLFKKTKKYYFFGPIIDKPIYETITRSHRDDNINPVISYEDYYEGNYIKTIIKAILQQKPNPKHSFKI